MPSALENLDGIAKRMILAMQEYSIFCWQAVANLFRSPHYWSDVMTQADLIGVGSIPIVVLTGFFYRRGAGAAVSGIAGCVCVCVCVCGGGGGGGGV